MLGEYCKIFLNIFFCYSRVRTLRNYQLKAGDGCLNLIKKIAEKRKILKVKNKPLFCKKIGAFYLYKKEKKWKKEFRYEWK